MHVQVTAASARNHGYSRALEGPGGPPGGSRRTSAVFQGPGLQRFLQQIDDSERSEAPAQRRRERSSQIQPFLAHLRSAAYGSWKQMI